MTSSTSKRSLYRLHQAHPLLFTLALCLLAVLVLGGYDGLSITSHAWILEAQEVAASLNQPSLQALSKTLDSAHPHIDLIGALWLRLVPMRDAGASLHILTTLISLICATFMWRITLRLTRQNLVASTAAVLHLFLLPAMVAQLRTPSATLLTMALWLGLWDLCTLPRRRWWHMLTAWLVGGVLLGSWSPMLLWACALILAYLTAKPREEPSSRAMPGLVAPSFIPAFILLCVPLVPLFTVATHPGLWVNLKAGVLQVLEHAWLDYPLAKEGISLGGRWYEQGKISLLQSVVLLFEELPLYSILLMMVGFVGISWRGGQQEDEDAQTRSVHEHLLIYTVACSPLILWAMPAQSHYGAISQVALMLPVCAMLVGCGTAWLMRRVALFRESHAMATLLAASSLLMPCIATFSFYATPSLWESGLWGGSGGAIVDGDSHDLDTVLSRELIEEALTARPDVKRLHVGELRPILDWYTLPDGVSLSEDRASADAILWLTPRFAPNSPKRPQIVLTPGSHVTYLGKRAAPLFVLAVDPKK